MRTRSTSRPKCRRTFVSCEACSSSHEKFWVVLHHGMDLLPKDLRCLEGGSRRSLQASEGVLPSYLEYKSNLVTCFRNTFVCYLSPDVY
ncbi:hypothetical protein GN956_G14035 [Arapaima gigas]